MKQNNTALELVLKRDRTLVIAGIIGVTALAWAYMFYIAWDMTGMEMAGAHVMPWGALDFVLMFLMWAVMMVAMMLPSAAPMILLFAKVTRTREQLERPIISTAAFLSGYVLVWGGFSVAAAVAQWGLHSAALISPMMVSTSPILGGVLLIGAGIFQWTPLKYACLDHCRSPIAFLMSDWRAGRKGGLVMGMRHGMYCLGCCWALMTLLFVLGVMNLLWIAALAFFVLIEKIAPAGHLVSRTAGVILAVWGILMIVKAFI